VVLEASDEPGILASVLHADGHYHDILSVPGTVCGGKVSGTPLLQMDGQAVFKFAVRVLGDTAVELMDTAKLPMAALDWLVPHQANVRILQSTARRLDLPMDKVVVTVADHGNTSAASVPLAFDLAVRDGRIRRGQIVMLEGVGGGFTWGGALLRF
jgi:3-oxoacyl-[acyl-carrier-protein] synthase-3